MSIAEAGMSFFRNVKLVVQWLGSLTVPNGEDEISCPSRQHCTKYVPSQDVLDQVERNMCENMCENMCV